MKKIFTISMMAMLLASFSANAQIGITRDGQLKRYKDCTNHVSLLKPTIESDAPPVYLPKTKTVSITETRLKYNRIEETWTVDNDYWLKPERINLEYDTLGRLIEGHLNGSWYSSLWTFIYKDNEKRIASVKCSESDYAIFKYDEKGQVSKILFKYPISEKDPFSALIYTVRKEAECHFIWGTSNVIPLEAKIYVDGSYYGSCKYQVSKNGRIITAIILKEDKKTVTISIETDSNGKVIKYTEDNSALYLEYMYDENGNVIQVNYYEKSDVGKYYKYGWKYTYDYEFY